MAKKLTNEETPKAVKDIDLHLAISLLIMKRELEEVGAYVASGLNPTLDNMLQRIANNETQEVVIDLTPEIICGSGRISNSFLRNIQMILEIRSKYVEAGKIKPYKPAKLIKDQEQESLDDVVNQLKRSGRTVLSSDYFWDPAKIEQLPDVVKSIEAQIGKKVKLHDPVAPGEPITHREKQKLIDSQFWTSIQIVPAIVVSIEK